MSFHHRPRHPGTRATAAVIMAALGLAALLRSGAPAGAADATAGAITVLKPWTRATPGGAKTAAAYLTIRNDGDAPDRLVSTAATLAARAAPHTMSMHDGIMEMRTVTEGVTIPPHGEAVFRPGGDHLMFEGLKHPLKRGESLAATLTFETAGPIEVSFKVEAVGAQGTSGSPDMQMNMK